MKTSLAPPRDIDDYIARFPPDVQAILQKIRKTIQKAAPKAEEAISYQIPAFKLHGNLVHFAAYKKHIGLYPAPRGNPDFKAELAAYEGGKGTVQFPLDKRVPWGLITRIVKFQVKRNTAKAASKRR